MTDQNQSQEIIKGLTNLAKKGNQKALDSLLRLAEITIERESLEDNCPSLVNNIDRNSLEFCTRINGHVFWKGTTYHDLSFDARCLKCGLNTRIKGNIIIDRWE
jgi:hypothetical protein